MAALAERLTPKELACAGRVAQAAVQGESPAVYLRLLPQGADPEAKGSRLRIVRAAQEILRRVEAELASPPAKDSQ